MAGRINPEWRSVRDLTAVARREAAAVEARTVAGLADRVDAAVSARTVQGLADAVDAAVNEVIPAPPQGVPTDRQALVALIEVLIAAGGSLATAIERDADLSAWFEQWGPSDIEPEPV